MSKKSRKVVAIVCSDLHLSHAPPACRAEEDNWYATMQDQLHDLHWLAIEHGGCPILCAGDVFDYWKASPELINFALDYLPKMYAIPGQHDLPLHSLQDIHKSAYWTLVKAGKVINVPAEGLDVGNDLAVHGYAWGVPIVPPPRTNRMRIALVHEYTWMKPLGRDENSNPYQTCYEGAPTTAMATPAKYKGWDVVAIGDNHIPWDVRFDGGATVFNCGKFMVRKSDELQHPPRVGLVMDNGEVVSYKLPRGTQGAFTKAIDTTPMASPFLDKFFKGLQELQGATLDFNDALERAMSNHPTSSAVRKLLTEALEHGNRK